MLEDVGRLSPEQRPMRLRRGIYFADILRDARVKPPVYHYIVQQHGSNEILHWNSEHSFEAAKDAARSHLNSLAKPGDGGATVHEQSEAQIATSKRLISETKKLISRTRQAMGRMHRK